MKNLIVGFLLAFSKMAIAAPQVPLVDLVFSSKNVMLQAVGREAVTTAPLKQLSEPVLAELVFVSDIRLLSDYEAQGKYVVVFRDKRTLFDAMFATAEQKQAKGVIIVSDTEVLLGATGNSSFGIQGIIVSLSVGNHLKAALLNDQRVFVIIPPVSDKSN